MSAEQQWAKYREATHEQGAEYQDFVIDLLSKNGLHVVCYSSRSRQFAIGENRQGVEIKSNLPMKKTGNLYIEYAEKACPRNGNYAAAGICRVDNSWLFVTGDYSEVFVFTMRDLRALQRNEKYRKIKKETSLGFLLPLTDARTYAVLRVLVSSDGEVNLLRPKQSTVALIAAEMKAYNSRQRLLFDDLFSQSRKNGGNHADCNGRN
jgi:hypothetical protein